MSTFRSRVEPTPTLHAVRGGGGSFGGRVFAVASALIFVPAVFGSSTLSPSAIPQRAASPVSVRAPSTGTSEELDQLVREFVGDGDGGVAVLSIRAGTTTSAFTGVANVAGDPITEDTPFRVGSISKPFVAAMILQLVDEGGIDLDAQLSTYLPDTTIGADVPVRMLLNHRSGLRNYTERSAFIPDVFEDRHRVFTPDEILAWVEDAVTDEPDQHFAYANTNYVLLGQLIEQLDGTDLDTALQERISVPLEFQATRFATVASANPAGLAAPWSLVVFHGDPDEAYDSIASSAWAAGALTSTTGELATFFAALFGGELISDDALAEMTTLGPEGYGLGLASFALPSGTDVYGHGGAINGYTSAIAFDPASGDTLVVLTNNDTIDPFELVFQIVQNWWSNLTTSVATDV